MRIALVDRKDKKDCSGCSACASACPKQCIHMIKDKFGFVYPNINYAECVKCGLCVKICQNTTHKMESNCIPKGFGLYAKNVELRTSSSSGGAFTLLAKKVIEEKGIVVGAAFSEDFKDVHHLFANTNEDIIAFRGSKYLQSNVNNSFRTVKELLLSGKKVLFSGTPCQIDGLKAYLGVEYDNLLCIDIVCHGVPSPLVWERYCDEISNKFNDKITGVNFRHKKYGWSSFGLLFSFLNNKRYFYLSKEESPYLRLFLQNYILRPSCYHCGHKGINRKADITIADFWGVTKLDPELADGNGTSLLLVHTEKGAEYIEGLENVAVIKEVDSVQAINMNTAAIRSVNEPTRLNDFWKDVDCCSVQELADKYSPIDIKKKIKLEIKKTKLYRILKKYK